MPHIVAANVRRLRKEKGMTQEELAHLADIDRSYLGGKLAKGLRVLPATLVELPRGHPHLAEIAKHS